MFPLRIFIIKCSIIYNILAYYPITDRQNCDMNHLILLSHCSKYSEIPTCIYSLSKYRVKESTIF